MDDRPDPEVDKGAIADGLLLDVVDIPYGVALTLPHPGASALQDALAAGNAAARAAALDRLATWFPGVDFAEQAQNVDDRRSCLVNIGHRLIDHLRGPETIDRLISDHDHQWGQGGISLSHADVLGHQPPPPTVLRNGMASSDRGWVDAGGLADALDAGWTAILHGTDRFDPVLAEVCADLSAVYGARLNTNVYLSHGDAKGFGPHWDTHDTIIVPVHGTKHWTIYEPEVLSAQKPWIERTVSHRPVWDGEIEPGVALIIPRGWGHEVGDAARDLSIHYTIGITRLEVHHVFERADFESGFSPALRADFPFDLREPAVSYEGSVFDEPNGLAREVATLLTPELIERAWVTFRARLPSRSNASFRRSFDALVNGRWEGLGIQVSAPGGIMVADEAPGRTVLAFGGRILRLVDEAVDAFVALAPGRPLTLAELPAVMVDDHDERERFAQQLLRSGMAHLEPIP